MAKDSEELHHWDPGPVSFNTALTPCNTPSSLLIMFIALCEM